jgi:hypothetical protein
MTVAIHLLSGCEYWVINPRFELEGLILPHSRYRRYAFVLLAGIGLTAAACSSAKTQSTATQGQPAAVSDTVTAIPSLTGVGTSVALDSGTAAALKSLGVSVAPAGSATFDAGTSTVTFPITSGYAEIHSNHNAQPGWILGSIDHFGSGLTLSAGSTNVTVSDFVVDPGNSMLYATVGGQSKVPLLTLDGTNVKVSMQSGDVVLDGTVAKLTQTAATALDGAFKTTAVKAGLPLGTVHLVAKGNATTYTDKVSATAKALSGLGVSVAPNGSATFDSASSTVSFPITGGAAVIHSDTNYKPGYIAGVVIHQGSGLTFTKGSTAVALTDFVVDPGNSILTGTVGGQVGVPLLDLDGANVKVSTPNDSVVLDGTVAKLTPTAAGALNKAFGTSAFTAGLALGTVHLVATTS